MKRIFIIIISVLVVHQINAQSLEARFSALAGSGGQLPFWLWANQLGRYNRTDPGVANLGLDGIYIHNWEATGLGVKVGGSFDVLLKSQAQEPVRFTELFGGVNWKFMELTAGAFADEEKFMGLSASNGNLASSGNARPHPKIRAGFNRFVSILPWFSVNGFYEEGFLNDDRYVMDTHLHRKAFYFRLGKPASLQFTGGLEHFVMWGGTHPVYGELQGWSNYFDYVLGRSGDENALVTDQINVVGNQYGVYQLEIQKDWEGFSASFYMSHPFDDHSGMELENLPDNLYGLFIKNKKNGAVLEAVSLEYYNTRNQSGAFHMAPQPDGTLAGHGRDNYFNHGVYQSGATYRQFAMVSPFFEPQVMNEGISLGFASTRFSGLHLGASGNISESFNWKTMLSYIDQSGNYNNEGKDSYEPHRKQLSSLFQLEWHAADKPFRIGSSFAADSGSTFDNGNQTTRIGLQGYLIWSIFRHSNP